MRYRLHGLAMPLNYRQRELIGAVANKAGCQTEDIRDLKLIRRSVDARRSPVFVLVVEFDCDMPLEQNKNLQPAAVRQPDYKVRPVGSASGLHPVVIGGGPAGLMAALVLARSGLKPQLFERGAAVDERSCQVDDFWRDGKLDPDSNVLYGEGGAGLFSDGKLTSRSKDRPAVRYFLETLVEAGADPEILIDVEPHLGTDRLKEMVPVLRQMIVDAGGTVHCKARVDRLVIRDGAVWAVEVDGADIECGACILATGHSARDVYSMLAESGVALEAKPFAVGVRVEVPQAVVDRTQWGSFAGHPLLGAASFRLTRRPERQARACYSFCMCPGGFVIPCASSPGEFTTNGMSLAARDGKQANAAFLVPVTPDDFKTAAVDHPALAGIHFQRTMEQAAFNAGGASYAVPACSLTSMLQPNDRTSLIRQRSCDKVVDADFREILPNFVFKTLQYSLPRMLKVFKRLDYDAVTLYAAETRSSSPCRIVRGDDRQSINVKGLYPCGEGAGYSGGIVSSAVDGVRSAEALIACVAGDSADLV